MNCNVEYKIYTANNLEYESLSVPGIFKPLKSVEFEQNKIDFEDKTYTRATKDYTMVVFFESHTCELKTEGLNTRFDIDCKLDIGKEKIVMEYNLGDEPKKIIIIVKDVVL